MLVKRLRVWMEHKRYSTSSVKTYADALSGFLHVHIVPMNPAMPTQP